MRDDTVQSAFQDAGPAKHFAVFEAQTGLRLGEVILRGVRGDDPEFLPAPDGTPFPAPLAEFLRGRIMGGGEAAFRDYFMSLSSLHAGLIMRQVWS